MTRLGKVRYSYQEKELFNLELRDEAARGVRRPGLGALDLWTKLDGARLRGGGARGAFSLWSVALPRPTAAAAVGEDSMATNGDRKARGGLYT